MMTVGGDAEEHDDGYDKLKYGGDGKKDEEEEEEEENNENYYDNSEMPYTRRPQL